MYWWDGAFGYTKSPTNSAKSHPNGGSSLVQTLESLSLGMPIPKSRESHISTPNSTLSTDPFHPRFYPELKSSKTLAIYAPTALCATICSLTANPWPISPRDDVISAGFEDTCCMRSQ